MNLILTIEEVRKALFLDYDYDSEELERLSQTASAYLLELTRYDFSQDNPIDPLAKQFAIMYVRSLFFGAEGYNRTHDYAVGMTSLGVHLQNIAKRKLNENA